MSSKPALILRNFRGGAGPGGTDRFLSRRVAALVGITSAGLALLAAIGCQDTNRTPHTQQVNSAASRDELNELHLLTALNVLHDTEDLQRPEALSTVVVRLNQWGQKKQNDDDWSLDPLVAQLPDELRDVTVVRNLGEVQFPPSDGVDLQQIVWLSAIAARSRGEEGQPVAIASRLFDWVVRNIQIDRDNAAEVPHMPRDCLLLGHGTAQDRAWIFSLLARQQGLDVVVLSLASGDDSAEPRFWLPALLADGELYLYDVRLGSPIPWPDGRPVATLNNVLADDGLLRRLDIAPDRIYPVKAADLERVVVEIEGSPIYLSRRMRLVEADLPGKEQIILTGRPSLLAEKLKSQPHIAAVELWKFPYQRLRAVTRMDRETQQKAMAEYMPFYEPSPILWQARVQHLQGYFDGDKGANALYQQARPSDADMKSARDKASAKDRPRIEADLARLRLAKQSASYWLGLIAFERGNYPAAIDYLQVRTLEASPDSPWTAGARYNLGRALEATGQSVEDAKFYEADRSPQRTGNMLRARGLEAKKSENPQPPPAAE